MHKFKLIFFLTIILFVGTIVHAEDNNLNLGTESIDNSIENNEIVPNEDEPSVSVEYQSHLQNNGWESTWYADGISSGKAGAGLRLEAYRIKFNSNNYSGSIEYKSYIQDRGWESTWCADGASSGTVGERKKIEAIKVQLTGEIEQNYDIYYRVYVENFGWLGWAKNGEEAGTSGYNYRLEAYQIMIVKKSEEGPSSDIDAYKYPKIISQAHVQNIGWQGKIYDNSIAGTTGKGLRLESIKILLNNQPYSGSIEYQSHIQNIGWEPKWLSNGASSGTSGKGLRLEAIRIRLTGEMASHYDIYYRVHAQNFGWLGWAKNGEEAGTSGYSYRLEAYQIMLVEKGKEGTSSDINAYKYPKIISQSHVQNIGWQGNIYDDNIGGTTGKNLSMESIKIMLHNQPYSGSIEYQSHIQKHGWETKWMSNGAASGTSGKGLRLEAIRIRLTGEMASHYDIYYRVHSQNFGWLGWAKNGEEAGSAGYGYRLEAYQIMLVEKGEEGPTSTVEAFKYGWKTIDGKTYYTFANGKKATGIQKIGSTRYYFDSNGVLKYSNIKVFADISKWQGNISESNWNKLWSSGQIDGVILRIGYWTVEDPMFASYISNVKRLNIPYSVYLYSYAHNSSEALLEAKTMLSLFTKYQLNPSLSVYYDVEGYSSSTGNSDDITQAGYQSIVETFVNHMESNNINSKIYSYYWFALNRFNDKTRGYLDWIAKYSNTLDYPYNWRGWQYTDAGSLPGIDGPVDLSIFLY